ncbi:hypothetical protein D3C78_1870800 [compost metagenome]
MAATVGMMPWWALTLASFQARERRWASRCGINAASVGSALPNAARIAGASLCWLCGR